MHAFLVVGGSPEQLDGEIKKISEGIGAKPMEFTLEKIEDARELAKFTRLSLSQKTRLSWWFDSFKLE